MSPWKPLSPVRQVGILIRDVRLLGLRFGLRHWRLQNRVEVERLLHFVRCVRRLGWRFGLRYWRLQARLLRQRPGESPGRADTTLRRQRLGSRGGSC